MPSLKKFFFFVLADAVLLTATLLIAFLLRFDGTIPAEYLGRLPSYLGLAVISVLPIFALRGIYNFTWKFVSFYEIVEIAKSLAISAVLFTAGFLLLRDTPLFEGFPRSVIIMHYTLALLFIGALRSSKRIFTATLNPQSANEETKRVFLVGADTAADQVIRNLRTMASGIQVVGIIDDDPIKQKTTLQGIPVLGRIDDFVQLSAMQKVHGIIIALPSVKRETVRKIFELARSADIHDIQVIPGFLEVQAGMAKNELRKVGVEDLLGREPAKIDTAAIERFIQGKDILITGAAGSIGSELASHVCRFFPRSLTLLDYEESNLFDLMQVLSREHPGLALRPVIADIRHEEKMDALMQEYRPEVVFHAAAYKHVPLMELFPDEAVKTNVFGTLALALAAAKANVSKFVLISTDKAVRPSSTMGQTKRLAEMIMQALNGKGATQFLAVQFGNVLASRGSVVPLFEEQIKRGGPVTVTDPAMTRFFMTVSEAVLLVLEAGAIGQGGEVFILDMGEPVKILDLAHTLIRLSGLEPEKDIKIVFTGARPGEKIEEELLTSQENVQATHYQKIFRVKTEFHLDAEKFFGSLAALKGHLAEPKALRRALAGLIDSETTRFSGERLRPPSFLRQAGDKPLPGLGKDARPEANPLGKAK